jgi:hypothetical protein
MKNLEKIIKEELQKYILEAILDKEINEELPKLNPNVRSRSTIDIEPKPGDTIEDLIKLANSPIPRQKAGRDVDLPTYADKLKKSREARATMIARKNKSVEPRVQAAIEDFRDRLARADTLALVKKADEILNSDLDNIETEISFPPDQE